MVDDIRRATILLAALASMGMGCRPRVLREDQYRFRAAVLDLLEDQLIDNLIRAHKGLPIVHIDYETIGGTVTDSARADFGGQRTTTDTDDFPVFSSGKLFRVLHVMSQAVLGFNYSAGGSRQTQLAVTAKPVLDKPAVYRSYLEFLDLVDPEVQCPDLAARASTREAAAKACPTLLELVEKQRPGDCHVSCRDRDSHY